MAVVKLISIFLIYGCMATISLSGQANTSILRINKAKSVDILMHAEGLKVNEEAPLLVFLHGLGGSPQGLERAFRPLANKGKFTVFLPCGSEYLNITKDGFPGFNYDPKKDIKSIEREIRRIKGINSNKIYLAGFSAGAIMAYMMGTEEPDLFAGVIAFGGTVQENALRKSSVRRASGKLPVFIVHGTEDTVFPIEHARNAFEYFKSRNYRVKKKEFEGGHFIPADFKDMIEEAIAWFASGGSQGIMSVSERISISR